MSDQLPSITSDKLQSLISSGQDLVIFDVRKEPAYQADPRLISGAMKKNHETIADEPGIPKTKPIVVYCVHGHEVSQGVTQQLLAKGYNARYLQGGLVGFLGEDNE